MRAHKLPIRKKYYFDRLRMIDCHAHLGEFHDKIDTVIEDAKKAGVVGVIVVPEYGKSMRSQIVVIMTRF